MIKICKERWDLKKDDLKNKLKEKIDKCNDEIFWSLDLDYFNLVKLTFDVVLNHDELEIDTSNITKIDNGNYQGTLLFLIPFDTYQPSYNEYLMTYVYYGSCSGCDTLQSILISDDKEEILNDLVNLCKDIIMHTINPYDHDEMFESVIDKLYE